MLCGNAGGPASCSPKRVFSLLVLNEAGEWFARRTSPSRQPILYPVPQNAPHVSARMNALNFPARKCSEVRAVNPWDGVYVSFY